MSLTVRALPDVCFRENDDARGLRARQRALWDATASRRARHVGSEPNKITSRLLEIAGVPPTANVLDVACGSGDPSVAVAHLARFGAVVGLDVSPAMIAEARRRAKHCGLNNTTFHVIEDETRIGFLGQRFDIAFCRFGLMFMPNPVDALTSWRTAVVPGGRIVACTHGTMPAFEMTMLEVEQRAPNLAAALEWRRVVNLASPSQLAEVFSKAGLENISVNMEQSIGPASENITQCWESMLHHSPLSVALDALPIAVSQGIREKCLERLKKSAIPAGRLFSGYVVYGVGFNPPGAFSRRR